MNAYAVGNVDTNSDYFASDSSRNGTVNSGVNFLNSFATPFPERRVQKTLSSEQLYRHALSNENSPIRQKTDPSNTASDAGIGNSGSPGGSPGGRQGGQPMDWLDDLGDEWITEPNDEDDDDYNDNNSDENNDPDFNNSTHGTVATRSSVDMNTTRQNMGQKSQSGSLPQWKRALKNPQVRPMTSAERLFLNSGSVRSQLNAIPESSGSASDNDRGDAIGNGGTNATGGTGGTGGTGSSGSVSTGPIPGTTVNDSMRSMVHNNDDDEQSTGPSFSSSSQGIDSSHDDNSHLHNSPLKVFQRFDTFTEGRLDNLISETMASPSSTARSAHRPGTTNKPQTASRHKSTPSDVNDVWSANVQVADNVFERIRNNFGQGAPNQSTVSDYTSDESSTGLPRPLAPATNLNDDDSLRDLEYSLRQHQPELPPSSPPRDYYNSVKGSFEHGPTSLQDYPQHSPPLPPPHGTNISPSHHNGDRQVSVDDQARSKSHQSKRHPGMAQISPEDVAGIIPENIGSMDFDRANFRWTRRHGDSASSRDGFGTGSTKVPELPGAVSIGASEHTNDTFASIDNLSENTLEGSGSEKAKDRPIQVIQPQQSPAKTVQSTSLKTRSSSPLKSQPQDWKNPNEEALRQASSVSKEDYLAKWAEGNAQASPNAAANRRAISSPGQLHKTRSKSQQVNDKARTQSERIGDRLGGRLDINTSTPKHLNNVAGASEAPSRPSSTDTAGADYLATPSSKSPPAAGTYDRSPAVEEVKDAEFSRDENNETPRREESIIVDKTTEIERDQDEGDEWNPTDNIRNAFITPHVLKSIGSSLLLSTGRKDSSVRFFSEQLNHVPVSVLNELSKSKSFIRDMKNMPTRDISFSQKYEAIVKILTELGPESSFWDTIESLDMSDKACSALTGLDELCPNIRALDVSHNKVTSLDGAPKAVRTLCADHNELSDISPFGGLVNLQVLDLSHNSFERLSGSSYLMHLRDLRVDSNKLTSLTSISHLDGLIRLSVSNNQLTRLDFTDFQWSSLEYLDVSGNNITSIIGLEALPNLMTLVADDNNIEALQCEGRHRKLKKLSLRTNKLEYFDVSSFINLKVLDLDDNRGVQVAGVEKLRGLDVLSVRDQKCRRNEEYDSWTRHTDLRQLNVSGSPRIITGKLPALTEPFLNLQKLELSGMGLKSLPKNFDEFMVNLRDLDLSFNHISDLSPLLFIPKLKRVYLFGNQLESLDQLMDCITNWSLISVVDVRQNPLTVKYYPPLVEGPVWTQRTASLYRKTRTRAGQEEWSKYDQEFMNQMTGDQLKKRRLFHGLVLGSNRSGSLRWLNGWMIYKGHERELVRNEVKAVLS